jgi:hypothetical protein
VAKFLWTQKQDIGPKPRRGHAMAFDSARQRLVLFGGNEFLPTLFKNTWEWDGENWTQMTDLGPRPRLEFAMAYDSQRRKTVLFGGMVVAGERLGDTWEWDGENWTQVEDSGPAPRSSHAMAFDVLRGRVVLFGGNAQAGLVADTWEWDGEGWTQTGEAGPAPRQDHTLAYDRDRKRLTLFGGWDGNAIFNDTWGWDGEVWTQLADIGPAARHHAALAAAEDRLVLFGGMGMTEEPKLIIYGDTWEWDGKRWVQRTDFGPPPRWGHSLAYDDVNHHLVLFGGLAVDETLPADQLAKGLLGDTWEHPVTPVAIIPDQAAILESLTLTPNTGVFEQIAAGAFHVTCTIKLKGAAIETKNVIITTTIPGLDPQQVSIPAGILEMSKDILLPDGFAVGDWPFQAILDGETKTATFTVT